MGSLFSGARHAKKLHRVHPTGLVYLAVRASSRTQLQGCVDRIGQTQAIIAIDAKGI